MSPGGGRRQVLQQIRQVSAKGMLFRVRDIVGADPSAVSNVLEGLVRAGDVRRLPTRDYLSSDSAALDLAVARVIAAKPALASIWEALATPKTVRELLEDLGGSDATLRYRLNILARCGAVDPPRRISGRREAKGRWRRSVSGALPEPSGRLLCARLDRQPEPAPAARRPDHLPGIDRFRTASADVSEK